MSRTQQTLGILGLVALTIGGSTLVAQRGSNQRGPQMGGTYELDAQRGDDAKRAAGGATSYLPSSRHDRAYNELLARLQPPSTLAIDRHGNTVTISSSSGPRATFDADGQRRNERGTGGRDSQTHAEFIGNRLSISTSGDRNTDYVVTFEPQNNGDVLFVTRRLDSDDLRQPVTVRNYYRRVANEPRWDLYTDRGDNTTTLRRPTPRAFTVPDGTRLEAVLDSAINTRTARSGQRFTMTVEGPGEYQGARIDGTIARITAYGQGRNTDMYVDFDTIRLRNGQTAEFDAVLSTVRTPGGVTLRVDTSGNVPDRNRSNDSVQGGAIGAALGAVIGAIAGGGKGAAIGAVVGGASGAIVGQDRDQYLDLPPGTRVTIITTAQRYR